MSIVFINDHPFYVDQSQNVFTSGTLTADVWSRFTDNYGNLTVIGRGVELNDELHKHKSANAEHVTFDLFYEIKGGLDYFRYKKKIIEKLKPYIQNSDYIVLRLPSNIGVIAAALCNEFNKKYFVEVVGCAYDSMWFFGSFQGKLLAPVISAQNRQAISKAKAAVYVTENYLQRRYPNPNQQINASNVVINRFDDDVLFQHIRYLKIIKPFFRLGMIGNVALPYKGYKVLFDALKKLTINFEFYIVGGGDTRWIKQLISRFHLENKVILLGRINEREKIYNFLDELDLYVQPSLTEGLPRSVIEAMSRACPVIASNAGGIPELIPENYTYNVKDSNRLSELIDKVLKDRETLEEMSKSNFIRSKDYIFETINKTRYQFLQKIKKEIKN
ncbi:glycosyltransferase family 4 protein [Pedobacter antarcticus]|uniref:glycosyltransferase family 4 protein n=1 Tax=Pedobacter antarcticus TaxID=34086 RepID=UPI00088879FC|nr:glycosyltransferase family 4 protein [Pedobacter antarcticus]SDM17219.1 Glycosyltransferase involved in cell wall bisynthesis [Pedobacter antarcticus]